jgi:uncharacterized protein with HEPN domain
MAGDCAGVRPHFTQLTSFVRSIDIIREATKRVPEDFRRRYPQIEWRAMAGMQDRVIDDYFGVDCDIVWDVEAVKKLLPESTFTVRPE